MIRYRAPHDAGSPRLVHKIAWFGGSTQESVTQSEPRARDVLRALSATGESLDAE